MSPTIALSGLYPRKEELVKATWNFDKKLVSAAELSKITHEAIHELVGLQNRFGFTPATDGLLDWQDIFRPLVETSPSFEVGGVTRLFETNKFFRQPILHKEPKLDWAKLEPYFPHKRGEKAAAWKAILPSPYWFAKVGKDNVYHDEAEFGHALATYVNEVAKRLEKAGYQQIQFNEAFLFYEAKPDVGFANELFAAATKGLKTETIANFINGNAAPHASFLQTVPTDIIGIDFVETLPEKLPARLQGKRLLAQVVNAQESHLETPAEVQSLVAKIQDKLKPESLTATHTWDMDFVPHEVAVKKMEVLATLLPRKVTV